MMSDAIKNFATQFEYEPVVENKKNLKNKKQFVLVGMGGSHLNADLLVSYRPNFPIHIRRDYGLPDMSQDELKNNLIIASSYSGNTEEVIEAYKEAKKKNLSLAVIAVGGKLIQMAKKDGAPYIQLPDTSIQPRSALGFSFRALLKLVGEEKILKETNALAKNLDPKKLEKEGKVLAKKMKDKVPVIYCSRANETLAWNWKIKLNETGKVPAFYNVFPELNHNEMTGFDVKPKSEPLSKNFHFIILKDKSDHKQIQKRMLVVEKLYKKRKLPVTVIDISNKNYFEKMFTSLVIADWTAVHTANLYDLESEQVPMVEEFKKMI